MQQRYPTYTKDRRGQVALTTVFLIGSFIILIALTLAFLSISAITSHYAVRSADRALAAASAGVQDGVLKLTRDITASGNYNITVDGNTANVSITNTGNQAVVVASSTVGGSQKALQATISIVSSTGRVSITSWLQI